MSTPAVLHATRPRFLGTSDVDGWRLKTYWVSPGFRPPSGLLAQARRRAVEVLPERPDREGAYGVGFLVVEVSACRLLAQVNWWVRPDELYQRSFAALPGFPQSLELLATATIGGTSELAVTAHEAAAWHRRVLANPAGPDIDGYLGDVLTQ
ncbi:hypothetical protein Val02_01660 [Virgisporangium aliadipatigenens]|uniref:Uncharacterized protein n=1 Tax=Virgisporangium aliadipatigenens TaxID=741659 RepID=A0A8J3YFT6_9ACTN|nr:hypothetical protein [Virgisporangium aliadipatigenens]GIJ43280.1 hypothetical protein Val02_01660 [Virgisporangium aliadipatigenens]